jgi:hypothetical protein
MNYTNKLPIDMIQHILNLHGFTGAGHLRGRLFLQATPYNRRLTTITLVGWINNDTDIDSCKSFLTSEFPWKYRRILSKLRGHTIRTKGISTERITSYEYDFEVTPTDWII